MRSLLVGLVLAGGVVSADPLPESSYDYKRPNTSGVFLDIGGGWQRIHPPNGYTYRSEYLRIAPTVSINHLVYIGAALQFGNIYSAYGAPDSRIGAIDENTYTDEGSGTSLTGQVFVGVRDMFGILSYGGEIAPTLRRTSAGMNYANATDNTNTSTIEIHARGDVWLMPNISVGMMVGMDLQSIRDFQGGLTLGFHVEPYDAMHR